MTKRMLTAVLTVALTLSLTACGGRTRQEAGETRTVYTMDTVMNLTAYGESASAALDAAEETLRTLDAKLDRHDETSTVSALNRDGTVEDAELAQLTDIAQTIGALSGGAFDPTVAPVMDAWDFTGDAPRVPSDEELSALLAHVGLEKLSVDGNTVALSDGAQLDLGGDVGLLGAKPDGSDWRVAVKDPADPSEFLGVLTAADTFVVTSGIYERGFEENGVRYHHIIDPKTGKPAESGLVSVTVVCGDGAWADALSTACFVLGEAGSLALRDTLAAEKNLCIELILVTDDGHVRYTAGLAERFEPSEEGTYVYEAIIA